MADLKKEPSTKTGGPRACQAMCMEFAEKLRFMADAADKLDIKEAALAFEAAFAGIAIVPYIIEKDMEREFIRRMGLLVINLVEEMGHGDEFTKEERERYLSVLDGLDVKPEVVH
jgi:hypothetical protein